MELLLTDSFCVLGSLQAVCATGRTESITPHFAGKETETQNVYCLCRKSHILQSAESGLKFGSADCSECSVHYTITACTPLVNFKTRQPEIWNCLYNPNHLKRDLSPVMWINRVSQPAAVGHHGFYFEYNSLFTYFSHPNATGQHGGSCPWCRTGGGRAVGRGIATVPTLRVQDRAACDREVRT